jgi:TolB protein
VAFTEQPPSARASVPTDAQPPAYEAPFGGNPGQFNLYGQLPYEDPRRSSSMDAQDNVRRVTFTTEGADFDVTTDRRGEYLYFASTRHRETADIYRQKIGGTAVTQLTNDASNDVMPVVSPDGRQLAFASDRAGTWDIYLMDIDGGRTLQITSDEAHNIHPSFSRDGRNLVYCSYGSQSGTWELVLVDLTQPTKKRIIGHGLFPSFSPTEDTIVFQRARERGSRWFSVWTIDVVNGEAISPTEVAVSSNAAVISPEWSPDGQNIVFCTVIDPANDDPTRPTKADVWVVNRDGSGRAKLTSGDFANLQPSWSPDGNIYFISDRGERGIENIWSVRPDQAVYLAQGQRPGTPGTPGNRDTAQAEVPVP